MNRFSHGQSSNYYARIRVRGKLIWESLKTERISVVKLRLGYFHKEERQCVAEQTTVARGKMTFADALQIYRGHVNTLGIKPWRQLFSGLRMKITAQIDEFFFIGDAGQSQFPCPFTEPLTRNTAAFHVIATNP